MEMRRQKKSTRRTYVRPALRIHTEIAVLVDHALRQLQEPLIGFGRPPVLQVPFLIVVTT